MRNLRLPTSLLAVALCTGLAALARAAAPSAAAEGWSPFAHAGVSRSLDRVHEPLELRSLSLGLLRQPEPPALRPLRWGAELELLQGAGARHAGGIGGVDTQEAGGLGASAGLLLQLRGFETERFAGFVEVGASVAYFSRAFPPGGTPLNGSARFGLGCEWRLTERTGVIAGARWTHLSNGQVEDNPGFDGLGAYLGLRWLPAPHAPAHPRPLELPAGPARAPYSTALIFRSETASLAEARHFRLHTVEAEYEHRPSWAGWLGLKGSLGAHYATGSLIDPNHGLGLINPGGAGFSWSLGVRPRWQATERLGLFVETAVGGARFARSWPLTSGAGRFHEPWAWARVTSYGAGVQVQTGGAVAVELGWRCSRWDTSDERPGDAGDLALRGPAVSVRRSF